MKAKTKSFLALTATLLIGMVLGGLLTAHLIRHRIEGFRHLREKGGMKEHLIEVLEPDASQEKVIVPIIDEWTERMEQMHERHYGEMNENLDMLKISLNEFLDAGQQQKLAKMMEKMHGRHRKMRHPHH